MVAPGVLEAGREPNERSPLLAVEPVPAQQDGFPDDTSDTTSKPEEPPSRYRLLWWALGTILIEALVGLFIKGWIEADDVDFDLGAALKRALGGGLSGAAAMVLQVLLLMPIRTIMNYQYRHGSSLSVATRTLYQDGGIRRYYQGIGAALFQGPIARFGDTAANAFILALTSSNGYLSHFPVLIKTIFASACAAAFRMTLTPIDTLKTTLQAQGAGGTALLRQRVKTDGIGSLWWGAFATAAATFVGHYPWFATVSSASQTQQRCSNTIDQNNWLSDAIDEPDRSHHLFLWLLRAAFIGFCASVVSDTISNSLRVIKTYRQVNDTKVSYSTCSASSTSRQRLTRQQQRQQGESFARTAGWVYLDVA